MIKQIKKYKYYLLSFFLAFLIIGFVFFVNGIFSGEKHLLLSDLYHQYYKLFSEYKEVLVGDASIFYSFSKALGGSMLSTYGYYLTTPTNLLLYFFNDVYKFIVFSLIIKFCLMSLTMFCYLKYHFKDNIKNIIGSLCYAFSLFIIGNYLNIIWLDAFVLGPLILLGIDKYITNKKPLLYIMSLFIAIISNFYMGFILCIFSVIYFFYRYFINKLKDKKVIINFTVISLLTGLTTMCLHLPNIILLFSNERVSGVEYGLFNLDVADHLSRTIMFSQEGINLLNKHSFLLYIGMIMIPLLIYYFVNTKIKLRDKVISGIVILIFLLSIFINPINFIWSFFSAPNCFNGRYVFIFSAFLIMLAIKSFVEINYIKKKTYFTTSALIMLISLIAIIFLYQVKEISLVNMIVSYIVLIIYLVTLYILRFKNFNILILAIVIIELTVNFNYTFSSYLKDSGTTEELYGNEEFCDNFDNIKNNSSETFYRADMYSSADYNNSFFCSYNGVTGFLSTSNINIDFYNDYGYGASNFDYDYIPLPVLDSILGLKYVLSNYPLRFYDYQEDGLYYNEMALSLGYMIDNDEVEITDNVYINQNNLLKSMTGLDLDVYKKVEQNEDGTFPYDNNNQYFFTLKKDNVKENSSYEIYINKEYFRKVTPYVSNHLYLYSYYQDTNTLDFSFRVTDDGKYDITDIQVVTYSKENLMKHIDILKEEQLQVTEFKDGYVEGQINVLEEKTLFTSIPYEKGWEVTVNGEIVEYDKVYNTFISIDLSPGKNVVKFVYFPPGMTDGIVITILSLSALITYLLIIKNKRKN